MEFKNKRKQRNSSEFKAAIRERGHGFKFWLLAIAVLPLLRGIIKPYWISYPLIGEVSQWWPLKIIAILLPLFAAMMLWQIAVNYQKEKLLPHKILDFSIRSVLLLDSLIIAFFAARLFLLWYDNPVGKHMLWGSNSYFLTKVWEFARIYLLYILTGLMIGLFFHILYRVTHGRVMERQEALLGVWLGLVHGPERIVAVVVGAFAVMVAWFIIQKIKKAEVTALRVTPGLFIASYIALILL